MKRNRIKKILCLILALVALLSLPVNASAAFSLSGDSCCCQLDRSLINSILSQGTVLTRGVLRAQFRTAAAAGAAVGCTTAASLLNHSLQNAPADLNYGSTSKYAAQIMRSSECREIETLFRKNAGGRTTYTMHGGIALNSSPDLYLAYNQVGYDATGTRNGDRWDITITFTDVYDFEVLAWEDVLTDGPIIVAICNYAAYAQAIRAIVPYHVSVTVQTSISA